MLRWRLFQFVDLMNFISVSTLAVGNAYLKQKLQKMKTILFAMVIFFGFVRVEAQVFKKIKDQVKKTAKNIGATVDNKVQERAAQKASDETDKALDKIFSEKKADKSESKTDADTTDESQWQQPATEGDAAPASLTSGNNDYTPVISSATTNNSKMEYPFIVLENVKFHFSDQPFTSSAGAKSTLTSQEFIYGRLELEGESLAEVFKLDAQPNLGFHYLNYGVLITPKGKSEQELTYEQTISYTVYNRSRPILIRAGEEKNTWLNFDVLPAPDRISTLQGAATQPQHISELKFAAGMDAYTGEYSIRQYFPANGMYTVQVVLWNYSFDDWGKPLESEKNIVAIGAFDYQFSTKDGAVLMANSEKRIEGVRMAEDMKNKYTRLPDWWNGKPFTPADAVMKPATLTPMIKNYCSKYGLTYITHKVYPYNGNAGWTIYRDSRTGEPVSRRIAAEAWTLYKDEKGQCRFAVARIDQNYAGGGTYGSSYISGLSGEYIDCSVIK